MSSLQELLTEERNEHGKKYPKSQKKHRERVAPDESLTLLPIHICHDRKSYNFSNHKTQKSVMRKGSSRRVSSTSERSNSKSLVSESSRSNEPAIDEVATTAVISILSGYPGRYIKDEAFRETTREKCRSCLVRRKMDEDNWAFANLELGIESIDKLVEDQCSAKKEVRMKTMRNSIRALNIVASLNSSKSKNGSTCGTPNSHLSACAQLYLAIVYKLEKNDRISARHLLQVFCDSPALARSRLLPDLWEHFFLPHLLHVKIWYAKEIDVLSNSESHEKEKKMKAMTKVYNEQMDMGTTQFAMYYNEWLKAGVEAPPAPPIIHLPSSISNCRSSRRRSSDSYPSHSSVNKNLYHAVFGPTLERRSLDINDRNGVLNDAWGLDEEEENLCADEDNYNHLNYVHKGGRSGRRSSSQSQRKPKTVLRPESETPKSDYFGLFSCHNAQTECLGNRNLIAEYNSIRKEDNFHLPLSNLSSAISTIYSSDNLSDCEIAIRVITKAWLDSHGDPVIEDVLSKAPVIQGMLEVMFASTDDEILELVISILAEFVARNKMIRQIILNSDPQLEIFMRLLRSSGLFLKAAILLYQLKPKAKQMISVEWVALVLRVLEFRDQLQTLFTVSCSPQVAALYFLDQLLTGFDEDRNLENAREVVSLGGLSHLVTQIERGDTHERNNAASIILCCVRADGSCRNYLADFLNKASLLELIVLGNGRNCAGSAFSLLIEILCLSRRTKITEILDALKQGSGGFNTMQILLVYLQRAPPEEKPLVAAILLQLDLMGDPFRSSVYREEAIEAIIEALNCRTCHEKVQERSARALLMLGGWFSFTGKPSTEHWLLQQAGFNYWSRDSCHYEANVLDGFVHSNDDEAATENWQRKAATVLIRSGNRKLLLALLDSIANGIPSLVRASLVTVSWMSRLLNTVGDENLRSMACSILVPQLLESLNYYKDVEERVLASYSLLSLAKISGDEYVSMLISVDKDLLNKLHNLSLVTWTANELISMITSN